MSRQDDELLLRDMLDYARLTVRAAAGRARADLDSDFVFEGACERFIEIVGEAASRVSAGGRARVADLPWRQIVATRNVLVHGYTKVDRDILWGIIQNDLPLLISRIEQELSP